MQVDPEGRRRGSSSRKADCARGTHRKGEERATRETEPTTLLVGDLTMNLITRKVKRGQQEMELQAREFSLLEYLMRNAGRVVSKTLILEHVWDYSFDPQTNVVDVVVCRLRNKIDRDFDKKLIHTLRGVGYVLKAD